MKIAMVLPYFGAFPEYAPLFFQSCAANPDYTWLILTDSGVPCDLPNNVKIISMTFQRCRELIQNKFDFPISLKTPQKLCDYKCAYGYLFKSYLSGFDFWGHCDMDQIFGELGRFVTPELLERYDKLYTLGHFTLYRNKPENNVRFMEPINGASRYREVFSTPGSCGFDEWRPGNINQSYACHGWPLLAEAIGADVDPYYTSFRLVWYDQAAKRYIRETADNSVFRWKAGRLYQYSWADGTLCERERPYVHLQKRRMRHVERVCGAEEYFILPNWFLPGPQRPEQLLRNCRKYRVLNYQYPAVKWQSLKKRLKDRNFVCSNVFRGDNI